MDTERPTDELRRVGTVGDRAVYRHETDGTYHAWIERDGGRESTTYLLVGTVAIALDRDPGQLEPVATPSIRRYSPTSSLTGSPTPTATTPANSASGFWTVA